MITVYNYQILKNDFILSKLCFNKAGGGKDAMPGIKEIKKVSKQYLCTHMMYNFVNKKKQHKISLINT